jgi:hypothetical protein
MVFIPREVCVENCEGSHCYLETKPLFVQQSTCHCAYRGINSIFDKSAAVKCFQVATIKTANQK